jgi:hypothetical protein
MYDRLTNSLWHQFTGEPITGPAAESGIRLDFFPTELTTWEEWLKMHPDTTVLAIETGVYPASSYYAESNPASAYYDYFNSPETMFPVPFRDESLGTKDLVLGVGIDEHYKAYDVKALQRDRVVNDVLGGTEIVVVASATSEAARVYLRDGRVFRIAAAESSNLGLPRALVDADGFEWKVTEAHLLNTANAQKLRRLPTHMAFWFGWYEFHQDTELYTGEDK